MPPMEIERKFTVKALPENLDSYPFQPHRAGLFKHRPRPAHPQTG